MCYIWQTDHFDQETTVEEKKRFIDSLVGFVDDDFEFHLSGGEPLLEKDMCAIVSHIKQAGFRSNLVTNGWLVDEKMARGLADAGLGSLTFSLDGVTARTHDMLRGKEGSFDRIMNALDMIRSKNIQLSTSVIMLINQLNIDEVLPLVDWVEGSDQVSMVSFQVITQPFSRARDDAWFKKGEDAYLWPKDLRKSEKIMTTLRKRRETGAKIGNHPNHFLAFQRYFEDPGRFLKRIKCRMGDYEFHVDPYGKAFFCCFTAPIGNIKHDTIPDLWQSSDTQKIRQRVYECKQNCHIMINCFFEDESCDLRKPSLLRRAYETIFRGKESGSGVS
jgi:MoaA/NifB/PqqE/SkfB family radical SAM enzyme